MKALLSIIAISLSISATAAQARDPLPVETLGRAGPSGSSIGTPVESQARRYLNVADVMGRGAPVIVPGSGRTGSRTALADAAVSKRLGRV